MRNFFGVRQLAAALGVLISLEHHFLHVQWERKQACTKAKREQTSGLQFQYILAELVSCPG